MNYNDIPKFIELGHYSVDLFWANLEKWLDEVSASVGLELEPDFQRAHVWDDDRRRRYVEYRLRGGHGANLLHFNCVGWNGSLGRTGPMVLVDGLQRLTAVRRFMADDLQIFPDMDPSARGFRRSEIAGALRLHLSRFHIHVNELETRAHLLQWYIDLNDGGVAHSAEEIARVRALLDTEQLERG
jgi:hypothetical protein